MYDSSDLPGPARISQVAFRPNDTNAFAFCTEGIDVEIRVAHTSAPVHDLSLNFDSNLENDVTLVYDGLLSLSSAATAGPPRNFAIVVNFTQPFLYDGVDNLLLEVKMFNAPDTVQFDSTNSPSDSTSRLYAFDVNAIEADPVESIGSCRASSPSSPWALTAIRTAALTPRSWAQQHHWAGCATRRYAGTSSIRRRARRRRATGRSSQGISPVLFPTSA